MTDQRTFVTFDADFPDDGEFSSSGDILVPSGRNVCLEIANLLTAQGHEVSNPVQHDFYGWEIVATKNGNKIWLLLQYPGPWLLLARIGRAPISLFDRTGHHLRETLSALAKSLAEDGRFRDISWFTKAEYESGSVLGSPSP